VASRAGVIFNLVPHQTAAHRPSPKAWRVVPKPGSADRT
jgi:hypothetical protein